MLQSADDVRKFYLFYGQVGVNARIFREFWHPDPAGHNASLTLCHHLGGTMAGASLLALLDDIATLLDDISVMTKVAAKKTAGVLGDDLALNAEQVSGVRAERELPVVWAVAKGSLLNKAILVPMALLVNLVAPWAVTPLLMLGGAFLCFEGAEKVTHKLFSRDDDEHAARQQKLRIMADTKVDLVALERARIKGAIRTDFILSAEIIVITLGVVKSYAFASQLGVLVLIALVMTVGVYGLVAAIVKLDDVGLYCIERAGDQSGAWNLLGRGLLAFAPKLMKFLAFAGTVAMFTVGGSILLHGLPGGHELLHHLELWLDDLVWVKSLAEVVMTILVGVLAGLLVLGAVKMLSRLTGRAASH